jgi:hypothetical protein
MAIMRKAGGEWGPIVEGVYRATFGYFKAGLERVDLAPKLQYFLLLLGEAKHG